MNKERLLEILEDLLLIYSPSRNEKEIADYVINFFENIGAEIHLDENQDKYGGNAPVIFAKLPGKLEGEGLSFSAHMDVIEPNEGLNIIKEEDIWKTDGKTTLGADDKSGLAIILYLFEYLVEEGLDHEDMYAIITTGEESGMLGARNIDWEEVYENMDPAKNMIVLDSNGEPGLIAYGAPGSYTFEFKIKGKTAHAGMAPEDGINAIQIAARAISQMKIGRIDEITTSNISAIKSDFPSNVVPDSLSFSGEVRSHEKERAENLLKEYKSLVNESSDGNYEFSKNLEYPALKSKDDKKFAKEIGGVYQSMGIEPDLVLIGGGSDGNMFSDQGFNPIILATGMENIHTTEEYLVLDTMFKTCQALINYLQD